MSSEVKDAKEAPTKERKRRRAIRSDARPESLSSSPESRKSRGADTDKNQNNRYWFHYEENQVDKRSPEEDTKLHHAACDELRRVQAEIQKLKEGDDDKKKEKIEDLAMHGTLQFVTLRKMNRLTHFRSKKMRDITSQAKQKIDEQHLKLQNLLYEVMHLQKEITKCLEFKSKDEDIDLVSEEQFYAEAPEEIAKPDMTQKDVHQQTLARLDWELEQRKRLAEQLKESQAHKDVIVKEIQTKKEHLNNLQPKLAAILQATKPVQEYLGMPFDEVREQHMTATYLPRPLYVLFVQASAYHDACDKHMSVSIQGDIDVARAMEGSTPQVEEESDSDTEEQEKPKERRRRATTGDDKQAVRKEKMLKVHPLSVTVEITCKDQSVVRLTFSYLVSFKIVTLILAVTPNSEAWTKTATGGDLLDPDLILSCLYPGDTGDDTPNPANNFALQRVGLDDFSKYVKDVGRPYHWVQWLCGLQFLNLTTAGVQVQPSFSASCMEGAIRRIRRRVKARVSLQKQLLSLEHGTVAVSADYLGLFPSKTAAQLVSWGRTMFDSIASLPHAQSVVSADLAQEGDVYYLATLERGSARLLAHVVISPDYPVSAPVFIIAIDWRKTRTKLTDENIRDMEAEVNFYYPELLKDKSHDELLTNQMQRLLMCFDVYLETEGVDAALEGPNEFAREKIFPRISRGPSRGKPYRYHPQLGFFSQR